jgi:hypothetical protein
MPCSPLGPSAVVTVSACMLFACISRSQEKQQIRNPPCPWVTGPTQVAQAQFSCSPPADRHWQAQDEAVKLQLAGTLFSLPRYLLENPRPVTPAEPLGPEPVCAHASEINSSYLAAHDALLPGARAMAQCRATMRHYPVLAIPSLLTGEISAP